MIEKISEHCEIVSGYAFKSNDLLEQGDILVIKIGNISNGSDVIIDNNTQYVSNKFLDLNEKYHVKKGDLLISLTGSHINQPNSMVGRTCRSYSEQEYLLNQRAGKIIPKQNNSADYLYYLFSSKAIQECIATRAYGAANQVNISPTTIGKMKWDFPKYDKQGKIGGILKIYDDLIQVNRKRIKLIEQMAENLYKEWFVRFRFPRYEDAEFEETIPKGWKIKRLGQYGRIETGKTPSMEKSENYGDDFLFIKTPDMRDSLFVIDTEEKLSKIGHNTQAKKLLPQNSIMVSCIGTGGIVAMNAFEGHTNQQINSIIVDDERYTEWLFYTCKSMKTTIEMFGATGSTMTNLSKGKFEKLKVLEPEKNLILMFHKKVRDMHKLILSLQLQNKNLVKQRDFLLPRLMSGKLEVK